MNEDSQKRKILRFLKGKTNKDIDTFCIFQWIERCNFHGWWDLGLRLTVSIPPNSLDENYKKRLDYLSFEFRNKTKLLENKTNVLNDKLPKECDKKDTNLLFIKRHAFENSAGETLRQIYCVIYFMQQRRYDFPQAVTATIQFLNVKDYQTVCDKCSRRFAGTVDNFKSWIQRGEILQKLREKFLLSADDYNVFLHMLS